jgi:hypothetical protein
MTTTESYGCDKHGEDAYQGCAMCDLETLRERLHEAELVAASWKREAELNEQAANESSAYAKRLAALERGGVCIWCGEALDLTGKDMASAVEWARKHDSTCPDNPLRSRLVEADALIAKGLAVVHDFLPNIGRCVLQDYQRMNEFCSEAAARTAVSAVQPERCCLDYPRCDCNSPPEPDNEWHCSQYPGCECFAGCREKALERQREPLDTFEEGIADALGYKVRP